MENINTNFWDTHYQNNTVHWDIGSVSPPLMRYINQLKNPNAAILIPGCGNSHEAEYLLQKKFTNITLLDIAPTLVQQLQKKFEHNKNITIIEQNFFDHQANYDLILEQTFFCAITPNLRNDYAKKMHNLLNKNGKLVGLLFNQIFEKSPPFGGSKAEYEHYFTPYFTFKTFETCHNSFTKRAGTELFINFIKK